MDDLAHHDPTGARGGTRGGAPEEPLESVVVLAPAPAPAPVPARARRVGTALAPLALRPAVQAAAAAAGGLVAGVALTGFVHRRGRRRVGARARPPRLRSGRRSPAARPRDLIQIVGTRSLLVDIHLLGDRGAER